MQAQTLGGKKHLAYRDIDRVAGEVRMRYITDVPGQQAVYLTKLAEARALISAPTSSPGPHLVAEAALLNTTPGALAITIAAAGDLWVGVLSPAIEASRIAGKAAVEGAQTDVLVEQALQSAIASIRAVGAPLASSQGLSLSAKSKKRARARGLA
jgi:hypothetical protein